MALHPLAIHELTEAVLVGVCQSLEDTAAEIEGQPGCPPCQGRVVPGIPAWDGCADPCTGEADGQLSVNVARVYPSSNFPSQDAEVQGVWGCTPAPTTAVELFVSLLPCAPGPSETGCPPSCDELAAAARILHVDSVTIMNGLLCCLPGSAPAGAG